MMRFKIAGVFASDITKHSNAHLRVLVMRNKCELAFEPHRLFDSFVHHLQNQAMLLYCDTEM